MKFTLNIVVLPLLPLLLATMALTAPMRSDETIREVAFSERAVAPAAILRRFLFLRIGPAVREGLLLTPDPGLARQDETGAAQTLCSEGDKAACQDLSIAILKALCENGNAAACQGHL